MDKQTAEKILTEILEENLKKQQIIITQPTAQPPHNGTNSKIADFLNSLDDESIMQKVVEETSRETAKLVLDVIGRK